MQNNVYFQEMVGRYIAKFYCLNGFTVVSRKRREHLSEEDLKKNKALLETLLKGGAVEEPKARSSLEPPDRDDSISWEDYIGAESGNPPVLGRAIITKESSKSFKATVAMVTRMLNYLLREYNSNVLFF